MRARRNPLARRAVASAALRFTGEPIQGENDTAAVGPAEMTRRFDCPIFTRGGQFILDPLPLSKEKTGRRPGKPFCDGEKPHERCTSPRGYDIHLARGNGI